MRERHPDSAGSADAPPLFFVAPPQVGSVEMLARRRGHRGSSQTIQNPVCGELANADCRVAPRLVEPVVAEEGSAVLAPLVARAGRID